MTTFPPYLSSPPSCHPERSEDSYREGIFGSNFTATISGLPDGKYTIIVGMMEAGSDNTNTGQRVFDISAGDQVLAKDLDIIAAAGAANKVHFVTATIDHRDDTIGGPIVVSFRATTGTAKMNTLEVKVPATGTSLVSVRHRGQAHVPDQAAAQHGQGPCQERIRGDGLSGTGNLVVRQGQAEVLLA